MHHVDRICACRFGRAAAIAGSTGESAKFNSIMERQHGSEERTQGGKEGRTQGREEGRTQGREEGREEVSEKASLAVRQHSWLY
jgi:hypothetical protein